MWTDCCIRASVSLSYLKSITASFVITLIFVTLSLTFPGACAVRPDFLPLSHSIAPSLWQFGHSSQPSSFPSTVLWGAGSLALLSLYCFSPSALFTYSAVLVQFFPLCGKQVLFLGRGVVVIPDLMYGRISFSKFCKLQSVAFPPRLLMEAAPERIFHPSCSEEMNR